MKETRKSEYREKIALLDYYDGVDYLEAIKTVIREQKELHKGKKIVFDVACHDINMVSAIMKAQKDVKALAFKRDKKNGDFVQLEGIILALRALGKGKLESLREIFKMLAGRELTEDELAYGTVDEFIRNIPFILPSAVVHDHKKIQDLNELIKKNILSAA